MNSTDRVGTLEIDTDMEFQKRSWTVQHIGWVVMALVVVAALIGLLGSGPVSGATAGSRDTFHARYGRIVRHYDTSQIRFDIPGDAAAENKIEIAIDSAFFQSVSLESTSPDPESVQADGDQLVFEFGVENPELPTTITLNYQPIEIGRSSVRASLNDEHMLELEMFVLP